jgi:predicted lipid carrier protein YhbT
VAVASGAFPYLRSSIAFVFVPEQTAAFQLGLVMAHPPETPIMHLSDLLQVPIVLVPLPVAEALANLTFKRVLLRHPSLFDRLDAYRERRFGFIPTDLPLAFVARPSEGRINVFRKPLLRDASDVSVEAPFGILLQLLQGTADGDALFFSRDIQVEGDMEALLALRNSLDDARVDLFADVFGDGSPLASMLNALVRHLSSGQTREDGEWN